MDLRARNSRVTMLFRVAAVFAVATLLAIPLSMFGPAGSIAAAEAATWTVGTSTRTEADVRAKWEALKPTYTGSAYAVAPSVFAPYAPGDAAAGFRTDGINMINFGRYLAGLPADVMLTADLNTRGQYGAVLLKASTFSHEPPKPAGMTDAFYATALASTRSSNIGAGPATIWEFQKRCLDDSAASNISMVGHRRWLLNPQMLYTGLGFAEGYHTTYVTDRSRPATDVSYNYIAWPSAGVFPVEFANRLTPWSITLDPARYDWDAAGHSATLRRVSDGKTWVMDANDTNTSGEYFTANFGGYGVANAFIFRPNPADFPTGYKAGEQYDVTLSGGIYAEGTRTPVTVTYRTNFGALSGAQTSFAGAMMVPFTPPAPAPPAPAPPATPAPPTTQMTVYRFYNLKNGSHFYTASATERDTVIANYASTYRYEGPAYSINTANPANNVSLHRFFNLHNGSHFYTASTSERDSVAANYPSIYRYEGPAYNISLSPSAGPAVYRFYNSANGSHFYTISVAERDNVRATMQSTYTYEGVSFYVGN